MAELTVTIDLPDILKRPEVLQGVFQRAAKVALDAEMPSQATALATSPKLPRDRGLLQRSITHVTPIVRSGSVVSGLRVTGQAGAYADTQESGRKAGARNPPIAKITAWVRRRRADAVNELATQLQSKYRTDHPKARKGKSRAIGKFRKQAAFLIARGIIRKFKIKGMAGKGFVKADVPNMEREVANVYAQEIREELRRFGAGG